MKYRMMESCESWSVNEGPCEGFLSSPMKSFLMKFAEHPEIVKYAIMINFEDGRSPSLFRQAL